MRGGKGPVAELAMTTSVAEPEDDDLRGGQGDDTIQRPELEMTLSAAVPGTMTFAEAKGDDILKVVKAMTFFVAVQGNVLIGGQGDDDLRGGAGNDTMAGGEGNDVCWWRCMHGAGR